MKRDDLEMLPDVFECSLSDGSHSFKGEEGGGGWMGCNWGGSALLCMRFTKVPMKPAERYLSFALLGLLSLGVSLCLYAHMQHRKFSILEHGFKPQVSFILVWLIAAASAFWSG